MILEMMETKLGEFLFASDSLGWYTWIYLI